MGGKHTGICVPNSVEMHLLHDCEDLVSMQRKLVSDGKPLFGKLSEKFGDSASTLRSPNCFEISGLLLHPIRLGGILQ